MWRFSFAELHLVFYSSFLLSKTAYLGYTLRLQSLCSRLVWWRCRSFIRRSVNASNFEFEPKEEVPHCGIVRKGQNRTEEDVRLTRLHLYFDGRMEINVSVA